MHVLKDDFFYHSNARLGADGGLENEKLLMLEEQKLCRARARKLSHETNRRRKALEERQKQWRLQEECLRDAILQQRHHKVQEATERFQRAHLPPTQRRTYLPLGLWRTGPNMEEALHHIQYSSSSSGCQSAQGARNTAGNRSYTPSLNPTAGATSRPRRGLSAVEAYSKLLLEPNLHLLKSHQHLLLLKQPPEEKEEQQEEQQEEEHAEEKEEQEGISPSERLCDTNCSESLSSLDSLENEDLDRRAQPGQNLEPASSFFSLDPKRGQAVAHPIQNGGSPLRNRSGEMFHSEENSCSCVGVQERLPLDRGVHGGLCQGLPWGSANTEAAPPPGRCALLSLCETIAASEIQHSEDNVTTVTNNDDDWMPDRFFLEREERSDLGPHGHRDTASKPPLATDLFFPAKIVAKSHEAAHEPNSVPNDDRKSHAPRQSGDGSRALEEKSSHHDSINNLNKLSNDWPKAESFKDTRTLQQESSSNLPVDTSRHQGSLAGTANTANTANSANRANTAGISYQADPTGHQVRFVKGILKKQSKYAPAPRGPLGGLGKLIFAKQVAKSIRDSMELARGRSGNPEGGATQAVRKKIRWLDEADLLHQNYDDDTTTTAAWKQDRTMDTSGLQDNGGFHNRPPDLQRGPSTAAISGTSTSESDLTRQAWADVGVQVGAREVRGAPRGQNPPSRPTGPRALRRDRPGRVAPAPASRRVRKGALMRPQSAAEAGWGGRAPGRVLVPHPPSRTEEAAVARGASMTPYGAERTFNPAPPLGDQASRGPGRNGDAGDTRFSSHTHTMIRVDGDILVTPLLPSYRFSFAEGPPPQSLQQEPRGGSARRAAGAQERGLGLHCTPTDEEISLLWHGVRSALVTKEARNQVKRQNLEPSGGAGVVGPRQLAVRPGRQAPGVGNRRLPPPLPPPPSQSLKPSKELAPSFLYNRDVWPTDEGVEPHTTEQHHAKVAGSMATTQTWRPPYPGGAPHRNPAQAPTTLSLEEQRILQSLDRLNLQLHCIEEQEEADPRLPVAVNAVAIRDQGKASTNHKQSLFSVNGRTHNNRRF